MNPETGGPCQGIRNIIPELSKNGIQSEVVCLDKPGSDFLKEDPFPVYALGSSRTPWKYHPKLYSWLLNHLPQYDILLVRGLWLYHSYAVAKAIRELKNKGIKNIPRVYIVPHGMLDPWFQKSNKRRLKAIRNNFYWHLIEKHVVREAEGMLFTCESELQLAKNTFRGYYPQTELNIGYGIQYPPAYTLSMKQEFLLKAKSILDEPYLIFLGRLDQKKGVDILIKSYRQLLDKKNKLPNLVIAGPGIETVYGKQLLEIVDADPCLKKHVIFAGMLSGDAKWGALYGCEAFILPSHQENFGIAVVEAMACSKPVLISNRINIYQDIQRADAGLVASSTPEGVESLLLQWLKLTDDKKKQMAANSRKLFESDFTAQSAAIKMLDALKL